MGRIPNPGASDSVPAPPHSQLPMTPERAKEFLSGLKAGDRIFLRNPYAANGAEQWYPYLVLAQEPAVRRVPRCRAGREHSRVSLRRHQHAGPIIQLCACELAEGKRQITVQRIPADATHILSLTGFLDAATGRTWQAALCGILLEYKDLGELLRAGHSAHLILGEISEEISCPGCRLRVGYQP